MSQLLLSETPLSLRTLCCISVIVNGKDKSLLPKEIKETIHQLQDMDKHNLLIYISSKKIVEKHLMAEFFAATGKQMDCQKRLLSWKNIEAIRTEVKIYRRFLTSFVPSRQEREDWGLFRKKYLYELLMAQFGIEFSQKEINSTVLWTGPELPGVFSFL